MENAEYEQKIKIAVDEMFKLKAENMTLRNELCLKCGKYKHAHSGACDGCRWKNGGLI